MGDSPEILRQFLQDYQNYVIDVLQPTLLDIRNLFSTWMDSDYWGSRAPLSRLPSPSPIHHRWSRIKRPESVVDKILRKPSVFPAGLNLESVRRMHDAVAGRVAVYFLSNIPLIDTEISDSEDLEVHPDVPPVAYLNQDLISRLSLNHVRREDKESGYASVHYIVRFRRSTLPLEQRPWFELQVRTITEHVWAELHHILGYKPDKRTSFAVKKTFQIISSQLNAIDEHFNLLFEELTRFQEEVNYKDADPLNAENLPAVLDELGTGCAQREIDGLLRMLNSRGIETVHKLREVGTPANIELVSNTFRRHEKRSPTNFEIVASIAALREIEEAESKITAIETQIEFLKAWESLKRKFDPRGPGEGPGV